MTREETIKILAILKAAYPNSYRNMSKDEATGTVMVWAMQFSTVPAEIVMIAINKLISTNPFPPAICEVKQKIADLYWETYEELFKHKKYKHLSPEQHERYEQIFAYAERYRKGTKPEPTLPELMGNTQSYLLGGENK